VYLRNLINLCNGLKHSRSRVVLDPASRDDVDWWDSCIHLFNGRQIMLDRQPITSVFTDACNSGAGVSMEVIGFTLTGM